MTSDSIFFGACILLLGVFIASVSQVLLKKSAQENHSTLISEYLNPLVIFAYLLFFGTTLLSVAAYKYIPLSLAPILESSSYIYVTIFAVVFFKEKISWRKWIALGLIVTGAIVFACGS